MISADNLTKSYGGQILFNGVTFKLNSRERVGLVGRNGHGKTTLFRMIMGEEQPDEGAIVIPKNYRIGYVRQHIAFTKNTILGEGMTGLPVNERDHYWKVEKVLSGLGFSQTDMERHPDEFSGGYQVRLNLAKVLVSEPDLLLLDEPTNYLDITSIRWVERFLNAWPRELILITHDRGFMDNVVTHILGVHHRTFRKITGNTEKYYMQIAQEEEVYENTRINDQKRRKEIEQFITRFRAKARLANLVQSRIKTLSKMEKKEKLEKLKTLDFSFRSEPFSGKQVLTAQSISFSYNDKIPLIRNFKLIVKPGDRICVVGKNGMGKTTLLKLLAGKLTPDTGSISYHPKTVKGFYEQTNIESLVESRTIEEEILYTDVHVDRQQARNICGAMMFEGDAALKKIGVLSGGEKSRVMLGKLLVTPVNLLLLDEPTNHLDMESTDAMIAAVDNFDGTIVMVTHNEMLLHALADRLIVFQDDRIIVFEGSYQDFLDKTGWQNETGRLQPTQNETPVPASENQVSKQDKKQMKRQRAEATQALSRLLKPVEQQIAQVEAVITESEKELDRLNHEMLSASQTGKGDKIAALSREIHHCRQIIDANYETLEALTDQVETERTRFEAQQETSDK